MSTRKPTQAHQDLTIAQAAEELQVDPITIRRYIAGGTLAAYRIKGSRLVRIPRSGIEALKQPIFGGDAA